MRKWLICIFLLGLVLFPSAAGAQGGTKLASLNVELWSEYDQSSMLVITRFVVSPETPLPTAVTLRFPKDAHLYAVALEKDKKPYIKEVDPPIEQGDWQTVTINVESYDTHRIEYYEPLKRNGTDRKFDYRWFGDYSVKQFDINILIPADSTDLVTSPVLQSTALSPDGTLLTGAVTKNDLKVMNSFQFDLEYQRTSTALAAPGKGDEIQPAEPVGKDTPGRVSITNLPWMIGGFGLALIVIALFSYWRSTQTGEEKPRQRRRDQPNEETAGQTYCHECGTRAHPGDRFCRTCGSKLRME